MKRALIMLFAVVMLVSLALAGCGSSAASGGNSPASEAASVQAVSTAAPAQPVSLRIAWWGNQTRNDRTQKVMDLYNQKNPNVTLQGEFVDWSGYWNKLATQAAGNDLPDVIQMDYSYIDQYVSKNLLLDLTPYTTNGDLDVSDISPNTLASGKVNSGLYGISLGTNALSIFYDPAVFQKAGISVPDSSWTWDDYSKILTQVYKATGIQANPLLSTDPSTELEFLARQNGFSLYNKDGKSLGFTDPKIVQFLFDQVASLTNSKVYVSPDKMSASTAIEDDFLVKGQSFMSSGWSNQFVAFENAAKRPLAMINLPMGGNSMGLYDKPSMFFSVAATTKTKDESVKFVDFFTNSVDANNILLAERGVPVASKVRDGIKTSVDSATAQTFDYINNIDNVWKITGPINQPAPATGGQVVTAFKNLYDQVAYGKLQPADATAKFMKQANDILSKG